VTSDPNVEFLHDLYADWARGNFRRTDVFDPALVFVTDYPERATYYGLEGLREGWLGWLAAWDDFTTEAEEFISAGNGCFLVVVHLTGRGKESGVPIDAHAFNVVKLVEGKIVRLELHMQREDALEAAGLSE
jgi:ketosteroid isomerase-like protein